jgi:ribosome maturation protein Sdo1
VVKEYGITDEKWLNDGSLVVRIRIAAGIKEAVFRRLGSLTEGNVKIEEAAEKK